MSDASSERAAPWPLPWLCLGLLALPFHPLWVDFEQVRRGLLLLLTGGVLLAWPRLPHVRGERIGNAFVLLMIGCALLQVLLEAVARDDGTPASFQPWLSAYRVAHWFAILVLVRCGAACGGRQVALPLGVALGLTSLFGLLQATGTAAIGTYGLAREPVSTLGNLNVASEWTATAAAAAAALLPTVTTTWRRFVLPTALALAAAYLVVNGSRSGLIALPIGLLLLAILRRRNGGYPPLVYALCGGMLGLGLALLSPAGEPLDAKAQLAAQRRGTSTLAVRFEIARGAAQLLGESPVFGHGPGQFQVQYPRHRSQHEIEASSHGREFASEVRTAHDDWIELLVDGGIPALIVFACMLFALQRGMRDKGRLVPLFVLLLLMLVRAPLFNAPAVAAAFLLVGTRAPADEETTKRRRAMRLLSIAAGALMVFLGVLPVMGNFAFVPYLRAQQQGTQPPVAAATAAGWWMPFEPRWREVEAREYLLRGELQHAEELARDALALRPFAPQLYVLLGEVLARGKQWGPAFLAAEAGLGLDAQNPELRVLQSVIHAQLGDVERAITTVCVDPHPLVRARLANHFADLARLADARNEHAAAKRYLIEHHFVALLDELDSSDPEALVAIGHHYGELRQAIDELDRKLVDARREVAGGLYALALDREVMAQGFGKAAQKNPAQLTPWQRALLGEHLDALRALPEWRAALGGGGE